MGAAKSNYCDNGRARADPVRGGEHRGLERRDGSPADANRNRCPAI